MIQEWLPAYQSRCNASLREFLDDRYGGLTLEGAENTYIEAIRYGIEGGGKRLRPILAILGYEYVTGRSAPSEVIRGFLGIEAIHCYTLIHDDLPCMDNDEYRRGKPTVWKRYGETMAVLIGDVLQTLGFEMLASLGNARIVHEITHALGDLGVVRGQIRDTLMDQRELSLDSLLELHDMKTGGFIASSLVIGGLTGGGDDMMIEKFRHFGMLLGRAFQIRDDILDYEGDPTLMGKSTQKDLSLGKGIVSKVGIEEAKSLLSSLREEMEILAREWNDEKIWDIMEYVVSREK